MKKKKLKESSPLLSLFKNYIFRERKRDFPFRREKKKNGENFHCDARFISEIYASIFLSLFLLSLTSHHHSNRTIKLSHIFFTRLPSSPLFSVFNVCFLPFSLSLSRSLPLSSSYPLDRSSSLAVVTPQIRPSFSFSLSLLLSRTILPRSLAPSFRDTS